MFEDLFHTSIAPVELVLRASLVYIAILLLLRISGKRQLGQMSATEFVAILLISNAVQNSMNGGDNSLVGGFILAAVLIFMSWLISVLVYRSKKMSRIFEGTPTLLIHKGKVLEENLRKERLTLSELRTLIRREGIHQIQDVDSAVLEADGHLSLFRESDSR